jgi:hypothetical protein
VVLRFYTILYLEDILLFFTIPFDYDKLGMKVSILVRMKNTNALPFNQVVLANGIIYI